MNLVVLLGANYARALAMRGMEPIVEGVSALLLAACLFAVVTAAWRASR